MKQRISTLVLTALLCLLLSIPLLLTGCGGDNPATENTLTAVIPDGKGEITVKAVLTDVFLDSYLEKKVYLFEFPSSHGEEEADLSDMIPVAEAVPKAETTVTVSVMDGTRSRLYSSFLLASYDSKTHTYTPLTGLLAATDLSDMAPSRPKKGNEAEVSLKGLISDHPEDAIRLGISHTVVDVSMDKLILRGWQEGAIAYVYGGVTRYLNAAEMDRLDGLIGTYAAGGVKVYLRFVLGAPSEGYTPPDCLYAPTDAAVLGKDGYSAVNMYDPAAAEIVEGFFDFMADRYASPEEGDPAVTSFILGYRVNHSAVYHPGGSAESYEKLVRVACTALQSHNADGQVYISLDSLQTSAEGEDRMDIPTFLEAFTKACELRGDYDWNLACELYAESPRIWDADGERDTRYYTVQSLRNLTDLLAGEAYAVPGGGARRLLISGFSVPAATSESPASQENNTQQAASYAFAYLTCVENGGVEALIYDTYADTSASCGGLWRTASEDGAVTLWEQRPLYGIFKQVDTTAMSALSGGLSAIIDTPYTRLERALAGKEPFVKLVEGKGTLEAFSSTHPKSTPLFVFDGGSLCGFEDGGSLTYMELSRVEVPDTVILYNRFDRGADCDPMGITATVFAAELLDSERLIVDLYAGAVRSEGGKECRPTVTLRMTRGAKGAVSEGAGTVIYEASVAEVSGGVWQSAVFDIREFVALLDASDEVTLTLSMDYDPAESAPLTNHMGIVGFYTASGDASSAGLPTGAVVAIVAVAAAVVLGGFSFLFFRRKR